MTEFRAQETIRFEKYLDKPVVVLTDEMHHYVGTLKSYDLFGNVVMSGTRLMLEDGEQDLGLLRITSQSIQALGPLEE